MVELQFRVKAAVSFQYNFSFYRGFQISSVPAVYPTQSTPVHIQYAKSDLALPVNLGPRCGMRWKPSEWRSTTVMRW